MWGGHLPTLVPLAPSLTQVVYERKSVVSKCFLID